MREFTIAFAAAAALAGAAPAYAGGGGGGAGGIVFDPTNYTQNVVSATQAVSAEAQRAQQFALQVQQYASQMRNLAKMADPGGIIRDYAPEVDAAIKYVGTLRSLYGDLNGLRETIEQQYRAQAMSGLRWDQYVERELALAQRKFGTAQAGFSAVQSAMQRIGSDYAQMRAAQEKIRGTDGMQGQMELTNQQLNQLVSMNREILTGIAALVQAASEHLLQEGASHEQGSVDTDKLKEIAARASRAAADAANRLRAGQDSFYKRSR